MRYLLLLAALVGFFTLSPNTVSAANETLEIEALKKELHAVEEELHALEEEVEHGKSHDAHADAAHGDSHEEGGLPQLDPEWFLSQIFWLAVTFSFLYVVFKIKVLPDLSGIIERRRERIQNDLDTAQDLKEEAERVHATYEEALAEARAKSSALFKHIEEKKKEKEVEAYEEFKGRVSVEVRKAEKEIQKAKADVMQDITEVAAEIASMAAEKIVGVSADKKQAISMIENLDKKKSGLKVVK